MDNLIRVENLLIFINYFYGMKIKIGVYFNFKIIIKNNVIGIQIFLMISNLKMIII